MGFFSKKSQLINLKISILCTVLIILDLTTKWWTHQNVEHYASGIMFYDNGATSSFLYKLTDLKESLALLASCIIIISIIYTLLSFLALGTYEFELKINLIIIGLYLISLGTLLFFLKPNILINIDYKRHMDERVKVAAMVEKGELGKGINSYEVIELPKEYKNLSIDDGTIIATRTEGKLRVYFTTYRGVFSNERSVFAYSPGDNRRLRTESGGFVYESKKLTNKWFKALIKR